MSNLTAARKMRQETYKLELMKRRIAVAWHKKHCPRCNGTETSFYDQVIAAVQQHQQGDPGHGAH